MKGLSLYVILVIGLLLSMLLGLCMAGLDFGALMEMLGLLTLSCVVCPGVGLLTLELLRHAVARLVARLSQIDNSNNSWND